MHNLRGLFVIRGIMPMLSIRGIMPMLSIRGVMPMILSITLPGIPQPLDTHTFVHTVGCKYIVHLRFLDTHPFVHTVGCKYIMYLSFLEFYNEEIVDLLVKGKSQVCCKPVAVCMHGGSASSGTLRNI